jgi:quercetin dioxygenase-like cupin family protein
VTTAYALPNDLARQTEPPADGALSGTIHRDDRLEAVLFGVRTGQEFSEHTASLPAIMHFLSGESKVGLGVDTETAVGRTCMHSLALFPHSIRATAPLMLLFLLLKQPRVD